MTLRVVELFAGIGSQRMALKRLGIDHEVVAISEIDRHALASYEAIHGDCPNLGDITGVERLPPCDLVTYSFPCQDLSLAGKRKGMAEGAGTRSGLVWEVLRLLEGMDERPEWLLMENVPQVLTAPEWPTLIGRLEAMGYRNKWVKLDSSCFGSAQKRVRAFMVSRLGVDPPDLPTCAPGAPVRVLRDVMEPERDEKYVKRIPMECVRWREPKKEYHHPQSEGIRSPLIDATCPRLEDRRIIAEDSLCPTLRRGQRTGIVDAQEEVRAKGLAERTDTLRMAPTGVVATLSKDGTSIRVAADWQREGRLELANRIYEDTGLSPTVTARTGGNRDIKVVESVDGCLTVSILTPMESWRLMGFSDEDYKRASRVSSETQLYNQAGNSIVVEVLMAIFRTMFLDGGAGQEWGTGVPPRSLEAWL